MGTVMLHQFVAMVGGAGWHDSGTGRRRFVIANTRSLPEYWLCSLVWLIWLQRVSAFAVVGAPTCVFLLVCVGGAFAVDVCVFLV